MEPLSCKDAGNGHVTDKICCERREALKSEAWARAEAIKLATQSRDRELAKLEERVNTLILLILGQLIALFCGLFALIVSGILSVR